MLRSDKKRWATMVAPPVLAVCGVLVLACTESAGPDGRPRDEWNDAVAVSVQVQHTLLAVDGNRATPVQTALGASQGVVWSRRQDQSFGAAFTTVKRKPIVRHYRDKQGAVHSLAYIADGRGLPERIFVFERGAIKAIVSPQYVPHSKGYLRKAARTTWFRDGRPAFQTTGTAVDQVGAMPTRKGFERILLAARDAATVLLPAPAHAEITELGCYSEWTNYMISSAVVAAAATYLMAAAPGCVIATGPLAPACLAAAGYATAFLTAAAKWSEALDKLLLCIRAEEEAKNDRTIAEGGSEEGESDHSGSLEAETEALSNLNRIIEQFVERAIASGQYFCSEDNNACVYYGT